MKTEGMNVLVLGSGAREYVLYWAINKSPRVARTLCTPGNAGIPDNWRRDLKDTDFHGLWNLVKAERIDLIVVGPEAPLVGTPTTPGIVDFFADRDRGIDVFGPIKAAAQVEGSKAYFKELCRSIGVPTPDFQVVNNYADAARVINSWGAPIVIKASGLWAGKGVKVCRTVEAALVAAHDLLEDEKKKYGDAGLLVIERCEEGQECSFFYMCDGINAVYMGDACDHKRLRDNDQGPNTGGMGAYSPCPQASADIRRQVKETIVLPLLNELHKRGRPYHGMFYVGGVLTGKGVRVYEVNCRWGDPEAGVTLPRINYEKTDLVELMLMSLDYGGLSGYDDVEMIPEVCVGVVAATAGYAEVEKPVTGLTISGMPVAGEKREYAIHHAGTKVGEDGKPVTSGGRVYCSSAIADTYEAAAAKAYKGIKEVTFPGMQYRTDIARGID